MGTVFQAEEIARTKSAFGKCDWFEKLFSLGSLVEVRGDIEHCQEQIDGHRHLEADKSLKTILPSLPILHLELFS